MQRRFFVQTRALLTALLAVGACTGTVVKPDIPAGSEPGSVGPPSSASSLACTDTQAVTMTRSGALQMRRLTRTEYDNTVRDLLGDGSRPAQAFALDDSVGPLLNNVASSVNALMAEQYRDAAEALAARADLNKLSPCVPAVVGQEACAAQLIESFGRKAFRRPLTVAERSSLQALYADVHADLGEPTDFATGARVLIAALLQAPSFLYRPETGVATADNTLRLHDYDLASRLSYFLWASMPDDILLAAAERKELSTPTGLLAQAQRMLSDPKFSEAVQSFHLQWLGLDELPSLTKDSAVYPEFNDALRDDMQADLRRFVDEVVVHGDAHLATLLSAPFAFVGPHSAALYGVAYPGKGGEPARVQLPAGQRAGLLTQPAFLAVHANPNQGSPIKRGIAIRERLLCQGLPAPPADVPAPPAPEPGATTRERFAGHTSVAGCASCHRLIDPIGFGFESYDGLGRYRSEENGRPIDSSGVVEGSLGADGPFIGAVELSQRLSESNAVRSCVASVWLRFALGRAADSCTQSRAEADFAASDYDLRKLILSVTQTDAFRYGRVD